MSGTAVASAGATSDNSWVEWDVTSVVTGNGTFSFGLQSSSSNSAYYYSKENGTLMPELVLVTGGPTPTPTNTTVPPTATATPTVLPTITTVPGDPTATPSPTATTPSGGGVTIGVAADALVKSSSASSNYGSDTFVRLRAGDPQYETYLKFDVSGVSGGISQATLRLYTYDGSNDGGDVYLVTNNSWDEATITYGNAPGMSGTAVASAGATSNDSWVEWDVTSVVTGNGTFSFGLQSSSSNSAYYYSKENGTLMPELVLVTGGPTPTPTNTTVPPTATATPTDTSTPEPTQTPGGPTATNTPVPTATNTSVPPTATPSPTATNTPVPPTNYASLQRITYRIGGQAVALRVRALNSSGGVVGVPGLTGLYYIHTDHLGSTTAMSYGQGMGSVTGDLVTDSLVRYTPFGELRSNSSLPTNISDRGFTGHKHQDYIKLVDMRARWYAPEIGRFISPDPIVPSPTNPQSFNRYSYVNNQVLNHTDPSGHCIDGITTWACLAAAIGIASKVIDYGITTWDTYQAGRTLADPNASADAKLMAGLTVGLSIIFEAIEPDDLLPVGLPADDIARRAIMSGAEEALESGGPEALEGYLRNQLGDYADDALVKLDELLGIDNVRFHEDPGQLQHIFRDSKKGGHLLEDTLENRTLLLDTVSRNNFVKTDEFGKHWFAQLLNDGTEVWVSVRNGIIQNGGVNQVPQHIIK